MTTVKLGIIGCGGIAYRHMNHLALIPEVEVVALSDINKTSIERLQRDFPRLSECQTFEDYKEMMNSVELDAVEVLTPHTLHFELVMAALDKHLHTLVEKPLALSTNHAEQLVVKAEKERKILLVSYQRRYHPRFRYIKKMIDAGELGDIQFVSAMLCRGWMQGSEGKWRQDPKLGGGGTLIDSLSHTLDIILWTSGLTINEVFVSSDYLGTAVDINSSLSMKFSNGAQASIAVVGNSPCWGEDINIWGSKGAIFYDMEKGLVEVESWYEGHGFGNLRYLSFKGESMLEPTKLPPSSNPDRNFINAILGRETNESSASDSLHIVQVTEAFYESVKTGKKVRIPSS